MSSYSYTNDEVLTAAIIHIILSFRMTFVKKFSVRYSCDKLFSHDWRSCRKIAGEITDVSKYCSTNILIRIRKYHCQTPINLNDCMK